MACAKHASFDKLEAKLDKCKFIDIQKKWLDITSTISLSKSVCLNACYFSKRNVHNSKRQWEYSRT